MDPVYKTTDGQEHGSGQEAQEHGSGQEAQEHQELLDAFEAHKDARRTYGQLLARTLKTADGQPLNLISYLTTYWWISEIYPERPWLAKVSLHHREIEFDENGKSPVYRYFDDRHLGDDTGRQITGAGNWRTIRPEELYASKEAAEAEFVKRLAMWTADQVRQMGRYGHAENFAEAVRILDIIGGREPSKSED
jgi:hypothetical protein